MKDYPDQPYIITKRSAEEDTGFIIDFLKDELPTCETNEWFIESVHLANMVAKLVEELNGS